jgi:hypothetical protein
VTGAHVVSDLLDRHPELLATFLAFGFRPLGNPILRKTVARGITVAAACRLTGVDLQKLLEALNARLARDSAGTCSLTVVEADPPKHTGCSCCEERHRSPAH